MATFPAQQRPPGDPALIERGKGLYVTTCSRCHGADLRGGVTGGPNLLRSPVVLIDQHGELILPIVRGARAERGMPALPLARRRRRGRRGVHPQRRRDRTESGRPAAKARRRRRTRSSATRRRARCTSRRSAAAAIRRPAICGHRHADRRGEGASERLGRRRRRRRGRGGRGAARGAGSHAGSANGDRDVTLADGEKVQGRSCASTTSSSRCGWTTAAADDSARRRSARRSRSRIRSSPQGAARDPHRQGHARRDRLPGDIEMTLKKLLLAASLVVLPASARAGPGARSRGDPQAARGCGRPTTATTRASATAAHADQPADREEPHARLDRCA